MSDNMLLPPGSLKKKKTTYSLNNKSPDAFDIPTDNESSDKSSEI